MKNKKKKRRQKIRKRILSGWMFDRVKIFRTEFKIKRSSLVKILSRRGACVHLIEYPQHPSLKKKERGKDVPKKVVKVEVAGKREERRIYEERWTGGLVEHRSNRCRGSSRRSTLRRNEGIDIISGTEKTRRAPKRDPAGCLGLPLSGFVGALSGIIRGIGGPDLDFLGLVTFFRERERERVYVRMCVCVYERNWTADQAKRRPSRRGACWCQNRWIWSSRRYNRVCSFSYEREECAREKDMESGTSERGCLLRTIYLCESYEEMLETVWGIHPGYFFRFLVEAVYGSCSIFVSL